MTLPHLTGDVARQLGQAAEALLSPLRWPTLDAWWGEVESRLQALVPGSNAMFTIFDGARLRHLSGGIDASWNRQLTEFMAVDAEGRMAIQCDATDAWLQYRRRTRQMVWGEASNARDLEALGMGLERSLWYHEGLVPAGLKGYVCATSEAGAGEAVLCWSVARGHRWSLDQQEGMSLLHVLQPALQAGHHAFASLGARQAAIVATLDAVPEALLVMGPDGREQHRNAALRRLLAEEPEHERLVTVMHHAARELTRAGVRASSPALLLPNTRAAIGQQHVATRTARYTLHPTYGSESLWGRPGVVLVALERAAIVPQAESATVAGSRDDRATVGMTAREVEVAQLLARRLSNAELAATLGVSAHTARHHTERVMQKLGVRSRREVVTTLLAGPGTGGDPATRGGTVEACERG